MAERNTVIPDAAGLSRPPGWTHEAAATSRLDELRQYLTDKQSRRDVVIRTRTKSGQELDWVPIESQSSDGKIVAPPDEENIEPPKHRDRPTRRAVTELELPDAEKGPAGTVPLVHHNVDLITSTVGLQNWLSKSGNGSSIMAPGPHLASSSFPLGVSVHAFASYYNIAYGTEGWINVWQPSTEWSDEFSLGQFWAHSGVGLQHQSIEAGVQTRKDSYGDWGPHIFTFFTTNNHTSYGDNIGGYNRDVDGWQQRSSTLFPGAGLTSVSSVGGTQYEMDFKIQYQLGNWWIKVNGQWMGYYPSSLFAATGMRDRAEIIQWGGEVFDVAAHPGTTGTDMGSGLFPWEGFGRAAYMRNLMLQIDPAGNLLPFVGPTAAERSDCYDIKLDLNLTGAWGYNFFWGGTGRNGACP